MHLVCPTTELDTIIEDVEECSRSVGKEEARHCEMWRWVLFIRAPHALRDYSTCSASISKRILLKGLVKFATIGLPRNRRLPVWWRCAHCRHKRTRSVQHFAARSHHARELERMRKWISVGVSTEHRTSERGVHACAHICKRCAVELAA